MLLPRPASLRTDDGEFLLDETTAIAPSGELVPTAHLLQALLRPSTGLPLPLTSQHENVITLSVADDLQAEAYRLTATSHAVRIEGGGPAGVFYGCQALLQLLPPAVFRRAPTAPLSRWALSCTAIEDTPRFQWRGVMLDVARHFLPKHDLLRLVDLLAMHRLNVLHLHLTDDQGWRIEIPRYPRLTSVGSWRRESQRGAQDNAPGDGRPHGGYYTQADIREIVAYAAQRHITVVPEIDVPGHSQAVIAAYPHLGVTTAPVEVSTRWGISQNVLNTEDSTIEFFCHVLDEIVSLFPSPFVGLGGDECPKDQWRSDPRTQELLLQRGLGNEQELQAWFLLKLASHLTTHDRRILAWDDVLEGPVPPGTTIASWRGMTGARTAAARGFDVVSCPDDQVYLDYRQSELPQEPIPFAVPITLEDAYRFDPVPDDLPPHEAQHILGGQANVWTEHMDAPRTIDYYVFPRLCAIAEALWTSAPRDFDDFQGRLAFHLPRLEAVGVEYRQADGPMPWQTRPGVEGKPSAKDEWAAFIDTLVARIKT
ncbi:beta-N-acetylhexosaminidase [Streptomyces sp. HMX112]|uniref:beta-N-acetylhexosaminidase n=1 Tax=Streptomyces sp. HMX112 TaxID=3390850 RepID=UPI003A801EE0